jgi:uncharacterized membrane protein YeaQ/YmgE (transglycosylase-associated protein family)
MNLIAWLVAGGVVGWLASLSMKTDAKQGVLIDIVIGAAGAFVGGYFFAPMIAGSAAVAPGFAVTPFVVSVFGAVAALIITRMLRRAASQ